MKFCYNTSITLPKQSQISRSVLQDGSRSLGLFWKKKKLCLITEEISTFPVLTVAVSATVKFTDLKALFCDNSQTGETPPHSMEFLFSDLCEDETTLYSSDTRYAEQGNRCKLLKLYLFTMELL